ncbi:hypothetical protein [Amycolatopsis sp. FDAARGOS 1241]|uniref:hypothetical protein n=1 Tax=Amycolatopsis sp. FDAARGOS 1241 TaxID=2778070 RepID=UPI001952281F|nr:hypothetical protein [Amycolatopsis sp. FDAARGOS 1241]QRP47927.1 hypothetical protein I6J71_08520 [Amycolatopsis sp. FDAARGOS 1241]
MAVRRGVTWSNEHLEIGLPDLLGLRLADGSRALIAIYNKKQPLIRSQAERLLLPMHDRRDSLLPEATVLVWDTQHQRAFPLTPGTELERLRTSVTGLAARYAAEWRAAS